MHRYFRFLLAAAIVPFAANVQAQGPAEAAVYVATYVEVVPGAAGEALALLRQYRDAARRDEGNLRAEAVQEANRPNRFALIVLTWVPPHRPSRCGTVDQASQQIRRTAV